VSWEFPGRWSQEDNEFEVILNKVRETLSKRKYKQK
jgi:hypothetical protein